MIVPTYQEALSIPHLVARLKRVRDTSGLDLEVLFMDDDSRDGSEEVVRSLHLDWVRLITRTTHRGLSPAVLDGMRRSDRDALVVMDADLSHPPEKIPDMIGALEDGVELVIGSRFAEGGSTADDWGVFRWLNSRIATALARPLTSSSDPMSGFFALRRSTFLAGNEFDPVGYKILLEIIIKCRCRLVMDIPIHFDNRRFGESKLSLREQFAYIRHLRRLYTYKYGTWSHFVQFLIVGLSGLIVNLLVLTMALKLGLRERPAVATAIGVSLLTNFVLNRRFSFSYARDRSIVRQFVGFVAACSVGAAVNYLTTITLWRVIAYKQLAAVIGVLAGTCFNFAANRFVVFRSKHFKPES